MRFAGMFAFELRYRLRQPSTWVYLAMLAALAVLRADSIDTQVVRYYAPVHAVSSSLMVAILATLVTAGLFVEAAQRDLRFATHPFFYTAPLRPWQYLGGRFAGAFAVNALLLLVIPLGLLAGPRLLAIGGESLGTLRVAAYVVAFAAFVLPNLLVNAAVLFGVAVLTRRALPAYVAALVLTFAYMFALLSRTPEHEWLSLIDPTGAVAVNQQVAGWSRVEMNVRAIVLEGAVLWNRLLWTVLGTSMLAFTIARFRLAHPHGASRERPLERAHASVDEALTLATEQSFGLTMRMRQMLDVAAMAVRQTVLAREFLLIALGLAAYALLMLLEVPLFGGTLYWPVTHRAIATLSGNGIPIFIAILTVFYAGELIWRERDAGIEKLVDSAPVPDWVPFAGKFLALTFLLVALHALLVATSVVAQVVQGYYAFEPAVYLQIVFGVQLVEAVTFALLALAVHVVVNQKYVGHVVAVLLLIGAAQARSFGIERNLLVFGSEPGWVYSDLNGFGPFLAGFVWFKLYWMAWALLLALVALLFAARGSERARLRLARSRVRASRGVIAVAALLVLATGATIFYNTNVLNEYRTERQTNARFAEYERRYKRYEHIPQPSLARVKLHAEIHPERREATMRVTYRLVNRSGTRIDAIHLSSAQPRNVRFDRPFRTILDDAAHGYRIYALSLAPGEATLLHFDLHVARRGFRNREQTTPTLTLAGPYTSLGNWLLPSIGYQREAMELSAAERRREHGLPPAPVRPSIHDRRARQVPRIARIELEAIVGTARDHVVAMPGRLQRTWIDGGRRYFQFRTETPVLNFFSVISARFRVREARWNDVDIRVLYHHDVNVERILAGAQRSLDYYTMHFGPYPHRQLSLVEFPRYGSGARAYGGQVMYAEASPVALGRPQPERDDGLALLAHEVAHQWWGQQVMGADVEGSQMLSETLAQYSAAMVVRKERGEPTVRRVLRRMHQDYLDGRGRHETPEVPLMLTSDHSHLHYGKGAVVMYALQDLIGEERVNTALRRLLEKHGMQGPPYATTLDLHRELQAVTPAPLQYALHDLLATITLWDLRALAAHAQPLGNGETRVTLEVEATKLRADSVGNDTVVPMHDLVDVAVFAGEEPLYLAKHRLRSGRQTITITVRGTPTHAGIDPYHKLLVRRGVALYDRDVKIAAVKR